MHISIIARVELLNIEIVSLHLVADLVQQRIRAEFSDIDVRCRYIVPVIVIYKTGYLRILERISRFIGKPRRCLGVGKSSRSSYKYSYNNSSNKTYRSNQYAPVSGKFLYLLCVHISTCLFLLSLVRLSPHTLITYYQGNVPCQAANV